MTDWNEIKRLAADFQKIQLSSTIQRLSERNCIEIISWLTERKVIDLIFTTDGKEYLTPAYLVQEIKNELYISGGRLNIVELSKTIGVDLRHINNHLNDVLKGQKDLHLILGQLIDSSYITRIAGEVNEKLSQQGQISVSDLTIQYDLPADFLQQHVLEKHLGKTIKGLQDKNDPRVFFTETFLTRCQHTIRGALNGLTRPTPITSILAQINMNEKLFFSLLDELQHFGNLTNRVIGAQYIPNIYSRSQLKWVTNFFKQNYYLEFDSLTRLGISDYKTYVKKQFSNEELQFLNSCVISKRIIEQVEADVDECIQSKSFMNLTNNLPSIFNEDDIQLTTSLLTKKHKNAVILGDYVISNAFLDTIHKEFEGLLKEKAKSAVESGQYQQFHVQATAKAKNTEEIPEKTEKKKKGQKGESKSKKREKLVQEETRKKLEIVTNQEITEIIKKQISEEMLTESLVDYFSPKLNEEGLKLAEELYISLIANKTANLRQTHNELQSKLNNLIGQIRLFEKGLKNLPADLQTHLTKYLLKTICNDVLVEILNYVAVEQGSNVQVDKFNTEQKLKFVTELGGDFKPVLALVKALQAQNIEEFMANIEDSLQCCSMIIKKIDKKKDRSLILNHKHQLIEQLNSCDDLIFVLHLATLIIFTSATQNIIHASGKHVLAILEFLKQYLTEEQAAELISYHDFVTLMLTTPSETDNIKEKLKEKVPLIKSIAVEFKKQT